MTDAARPRRHMATPAEIAATFPVPAGAPPDMVAHLRVLIQSAAALAAADYADAATEAAALGIGHGRVMAGERVSVLS